jgi:membrane dipeptidase
MQVEIDWSAIRNGDADALDGVTVEVAGWLTPLDVDGEVGSDVHGDVHDERPRETDRAAGARSEGRAQGEVTPGRAVDYCVLSADEPCCGGHLPRHPLSCIEVFLAAPRMLAPGAVRLRGRLVRLLDDPAGWRYRLAEAQVLESRAARGQRGVSRRVFLASTAALGLAACAQGRFPVDTEVAAPTAGRAGAFTAGRAGA